MPEGRVGRLTSKATFAALQRSRHRGASGPVRAVFVPALERFTPPGSDLDRHSADPPEDAAPTDAAPTDAAPKGPAGERPGPEGPANAIPQVRVGYAVNKRCGSAVQRNTLRRRMREVARATAPTLPRGSYLLRLSPEAGSLERARFRDDVATALRRAGSTASGPGAGTGTGREVSR